MLISQSIPNLANGVSQQPFTLRLSSQAELQENGLSTTSQGLRKRPPTKHLKKILSGSYTNAYIHTINRDEIERYIVVITNGGLKVFDLDGTEKTVTFPSGTGYLNATDPSNSFRAVTVADYTFIVNKTVTVTPSSTFAASRNPEALVNVKTGNYGKTYKIIINGTTVASYTTPNGSSASDAPSIATDYIATQLYNAMVSVSYTTTSLARQSSNVYTLPSGYTQANFTSIEARDQSVVGTDPDTGDPIYEWGEWYTKSLTWISSTTFSLTSNIATTSELRITRVGGTSNPWNAVRYGSVIHLSSVNDFTIRCEDGFNNGAMLALKDQIQKFQDLPANAGVNNFAAEIIGDKQTGFDNFWVKFDNSGSGSWKETIKPGTRLGFTATTMPHSLVRNADGTFTFAPLTWDNRIAGELTSNADPSFVGRKISDIFFFRNRLGFLADESVIFSEASEFFNFYRTTVTELLDSDPIDVTVSHTKVSTLQHAIPFNRQLLLFSAQSQFIVEAGDLLTPKTIAIKQATEFESDAQVKPAGIGKNVYFTLTKGDYTGVREYFPVDEVSGINDSVEVTGHVPQYIPKNAYKLAPCLVDDLMVLLSKEERNAMWVYKFYFNNNEKLQSSWSKWTFDATDTILNADFILSDMLLVIQRSDGLYLEKLSVALGDIGANEPYNIHLDRKLTVPKAALTFVNGYTIIPTAYLPGPITNGSWEAIVAKNQPQPAGVRLSMSIVGEGARVLGNYTDCDLIVGRKYTFRYQFSPITIKQQSGNTIKSDTQGRLQMRTMQVNFSNTGFFKTKVTPEGRSTYEYVYSGKTLGQLSATIGEVELDTGNTKFPILAQNTGVTIELNSDAPLPCSFLSADWEGMYVKRSRSM